MKTAVVILRIAAVIVCALAIEGVNPFGRDPLLVAFGLYVFSTII